MSSYADVQKLFDEVLQNWKRMATSDLDDAEEDADRFQTSFYVMTEALRAWWKTLPQPPQTITEALAFQPVQQLYDQLPSPLLLPFEQELESIVDDASREPTD